ncbi:MAG: Flp pilus assembly protein CpaB [Candidatus Omnitrophota bacterium]
MDLQRKFPLIIAIACGILAIILLNVYLQRREAEVWERLKRAERQAQPVEKPTRTGIVLLAQKDIPPQTPITPEDLVIKEIPLDYIQPGAVNSLDRVIGQIAIVPIAAGEQILRTKILPPGKIGKSLSEITPEGKRAVTVSVDNISSLAGLLQPGDHVDVFALITPPAGTILSDEGKSSAPRLVSLFQGVEVLAVGDTFIATASGVSQDAKKRAAGTGGAGLGTVTLALNPQETILLSFVQEHGKIKLSLRSADDTEFEAVQGADWDALFRYLYPGSGQQQVISGEQPTIEIYRGSRREYIPLSEGDR